MAGQQICLKWNSFQSNIVTSFESLWEEQGLVDVTLASDGQCLRAHKVILSACSPFFRKVFQTNPCQHPVIILQDVHFSELESLLSFMYKGEVNIEQENLPALLRAAETLQIRGLSGASEQVKEKMGVCKKSPSPQEPIPVDGQSPPKKQRTVQQSQSPPLPSTPLALTPTSRTTTERLRRQSASSAEAWEQHQQTNEPECPPKVIPKLESRDSESESLASPLLSIDEPHEESTDGSLGGLQDLKSSQSKAVASDTGQIKGNTKSETTIDVNTEALPGSSLSDAVNISKDSSYDPNQASRSFPYPPFPCPFCDRAYTSWGFRRRHIKAVHTQSQKLPCKWCAEVLPSHSDWEQHVTNSHGLAPTDAHNGLLILEEAHMVLQIPNPTRLDTFVSMIRKNKSAANSSGSGSSGGIVNAGASSSSQDDQDCSNGSASEAEKPASRT
ncbi:protein tramtrack, beta isoform-like isoform X1 [Schistocerca americana]|uniref:protein tramtrack, beta isoform-like isoform X1 n=1 Tax=Schistocerca americana TaxID=7009 RepID=UPI001F501776|nr:protein tramtrack, beta isoform-like isoform X1 [Schistocerca americana]